jgi:Heparinase II/III-like protein/Heparinase II/III N-terminus
MSGSSTSRLGWYVRRLSRMSPAELAWRVREQALRKTWSRRQVRTVDLAALRAKQLAVARDRRFSNVLPPGTADLIPDEARKEIIEAADRLIRGEWVVLGVARTDMARPDWFHDPVTGRRSDPSEFAFRINQRSEERVGNIKQVWEVSRLQHLTLLATAWYLSRKDGYAERAAEQLLSWWQENPFLSGVNWTSGIEMGIRLLNFAWIRRLLDEWPGIEDLFERNDLALRQIRWHQEYLAAFESRGSSANNHVIAEAAGQLAASCAFPWFRESFRWRKRSAELLERELTHNTFPSGINRELASDYHGFVAELGYFAAIEAAAAGFPLSDPAWRLLCAMTDAMAALVDSHGRPPRQADSDEGRAALLDLPADDRWPTLLAIGSSLFGELDWWPRLPPNASSVLAGTLAGGRRPVAGRPDRRPFRFADAGITILRTTSADSPEIWCRCDGGPHGFLSIAAHAHADALSVEVRYAGVDVLADPGTYCYHGEPAWRSYFRSTIAHNTVELAGQNQSREGGPFLWLRQADARETEVADDGNIASWSAEHDGYVSLDPPARHRRSVRLDRGSRAIDIVDEIQGGEPDVRLAFHFGPAVHAELRNSNAVLSWPKPSAVSASSVPGAARLELPPQLQWSLHRGETDPILGWYSHGLGQRVPACTLLGRGHAVPGNPLVTRLVFLEEASLLRPVVPR